MLLTIKYGNIFEAEAEALVNPVNCVGVMGRGLALSFKEKYPENFEAYKVACMHEKISIGRVFAYYESGKIIINFPTKDHWENDSEIEYIEQGIQDLIRVIKELNIKSIAIPPLGSGLGGLNWDSVKKTIIYSFIELKDTDVSIFLYEGIAPPEAIPPEQAVLVKFTGYYQELGYELSFEKTVTFSDSMKMIEFDESEIIFNVFITRIKSMIDDIL